MPPNTESGVPPSTATIICSDTFQSRVKEGEALFVFDNKVYKVDSFITRHPGGELAMRHGIGHDVTDEIRSMHPPFVYERIMKKFYIGDYDPSPPTASVALPDNLANYDHLPELKASWGGRVNVEAFDSAILDLHLVHKQNQDKDLQDKLDGKVIDPVALRAKYQALEQDLKDRGLFECNYYRYYKEVCRYVLIIYVSLWFALRGTHWYHFLLSAVFMAMFWHQLVFTAHDAGHNEITGKVQIDHAIGVFIANFIGGLSLGWWKDNHNVHHIVTNDPSEDPDIQHLPFFAVTTKYFNNLYSSYYKRVLPFDAVARYFVAKQHHLYYLVVSFGRFNLHRLSFLYLLTSKNVRMPRLEWCGILFFFIWYGSLLASMPSWPIRIMYLLVSYMLTFPLHVQITLSHFGMSTETIENEPFPSKMLRTTMDVDCPEWLDWVHGGLQFQAVHHLYPRLPRHNLRQCVPLVRQFCRETGLHYYMYTFATGNGVVLGGMKAVADQVRLLNENAKHNADTWKHDPTLSTTQ
ncbi:fatty acid/sphingolipid desaturase [Hesseltinella vesiculosa]|uniref:Fatty acid/sphingolipid desaturase n=1 Tax=Hesseltinella vesiculosa TaxID=101127 RepID=A0A1X2GTQ2_9FUNG|nr:fatty acid/sphingolipid desaturase [Hesseltinella vesiculosa]